MDRFSRPQYLAFCLSSHSLHRGSCQLMLLVNHILKLRRPALKSIASAQACRPILRRPRMALESLPDGPLPCTLRISFNHRIHKRWISLRSMEAEANFRKLMRPRSHVPAVPGALHLDRQLVHQQHTCLSDELGKRPLKGTVDPAEQVIVRFRGGNMKLLLLSHGMVWEKWLLERLVLSVLSDGPNPRITSWRRTATALLKVVPRRLNRDLEVE